MYLAASRLGAWAKCPTKAIMGAQLSSQWNRVISRGGTAHGIVVIKAVRTARCRIAISNKQVMTALADHICICLRIAIRAAVWNSSGRFSTMA